MELESHIKENWLSQKPNQGSWFGTALTVMMLLIGSSIFINGYFGARHWMAASQLSVFEHHEYWRVWTSLIAHSSAEHILSNLVLFIPFAYFLSAYFGYLFFPFFGFFVGGLINFLVLQRMPESVWLVGVSGVVYWMGAAWIALSSLINRKESKKRRLLKAIGVSIVLFIPDTYRPEVSYFSHIAGFGFGVVSGAFLYLLRRKKFLAAEVFEHVQTPALEVVNISDNV